MLAALCAPGRGSHNKILIVLIIIDFLFDLLRTLASGAKRGSLEVLRARGYVLYGFMIYILGQLCYSVVQSRPFAVSVISENLAPITFSFFLIGSYVVWSFIFLLIAVRGIEETDWLFSFARRVNKAEKFIMALPLVAASQYLAASGINLIAGHYAETIRYLGVSVLLIMLAMSLPSLWFLPDSEYWRNLRNSGQRRGGLVLFFSNLTLAALMIIIAFSLFAVSSGKPMKFNLSPTAVDSAISPSLLTE